MNNDDHGSPRRDFDDAATGEHPVLTLPVADESPTTEFAVPEVPGGAASAVEAGGHVAQGLAHLESEILRLHGRWQQVEQQFAAKDAIVAELRSAIGARTAAAAELERQLAESALGLKAVEDALAGKHAEVAKLTQELAARAAALSDNEVRLAATSAERGTALQELTTARAEIERLALALQREQAASSSAANHNEELLATQGALNLRIQELEAYIDGRANSWSQLQTEIAEQKSTIVRLERRLKAQERAVAEAERQKRSFDAALADLKQQNADLHAQAKEREAAHQHLEHRLSEVRAAHESLQTDVTRHRTEQQRLMAKDEENQKLVASLEAELVRRAETLSASERELAAARTLVGELSSAKDALAKLLEQQTELAATLAAELEKKQAGLDVLDRSVRRISDLGASVAELERRFDVGASGFDAAPAAAPARVDDVRDTEAEELLPAATFLGQDLEPDSTPVSARRMGSGARKLVGTIGGAEVDYLLGKSEMTIGRGKTSDIRIQSHYISRYHARISTRGIATTIEDVGSKNGILVNHKRVKRAVLRDGDVVTLASELELQFVDARH